MSKIAIIGAGLAGLTAALRLKQNGYNDIHLYEAKNRVGGRIHSILIRNLEGGDLCRRTRGTKYSRWRRCKTYPLFS